MAIYVVNAWSLNMAPANHSTKCEEVDAVEVAKWAASGEAGVAIGHQSTADLLTALLGVKIDAIRTTVKGIPGDVFYVCQYIGPRLEEGVTALPEGAKIEYRKVTLS